MAKINWTKRGFWATVIGIIVAIIIAVFSNLNSKATENFVPVNSDGNKTEYIQPNNKGSINITTTNNNITNNHHDSTKISPESSARSLRGAVYSKRHNAQFNCIPADRKNLSDNWLKAEEKYEDGKRNMMNKEYEMATQDFREALNLYDDSCIEFEQSK